MTLLQGVTIFWQVIAVLLMITVVVAAHELGHFLFARWKRMEVEEFAIGFWKKLYSRRGRSGTEFSVRAIPAGGFVRIKGMEPKADASEIRVQGGFYSKGLPARALVLCAGPLFSMLFGYLIFWVGLTAFGQLRPVNKPIVGEVAKGSPADSAGIKTGDRILSVDGRPIKSFHDVRLVTRRSAGRKVGLEIERNGQKLAVFVVPELKKGAMLIGPDSQPLQGPDGSPVIADVGWVGMQVEHVFVRVGPAEAALLAARNCWRIVYETGRVLANPHRLKDEVGGPIRIAAITGSAAKQGMASLLTVAAIVSLSLGIVNLFPIPPLDGGQLLITGVEALRGGRRLSLRAQEAIATVGIVLVLLIFVSVLALDARWLGR